MSKEPETVIVNTGNGASLWFAEGYNDGFCLRPMKDHPSKNYKEGHAKGWSDALNERFAPYREKE